MKKEIFISYSSKNTQVAEKLVEFLESQNHTCFLAKRDIPIGADYTDYVMPAILDCKLYLLVFSKDSNDSSECLNELGVAIDHNKLIVPVYIEKFNINPKYEYRLKRKQHIIAYPGKIDKYFIDILASIENCYDSLSGQTQIDTKSKEKVFEYNPERGVMINPEDGQRNVSFRSDTLINLLGGIYEKVAEFKDVAIAEDIFYSSGYTGGKNFGERIKNQWDYGSTLDGIKLKLDKWCEFDSNVGWGKFSIEFDYDEENEVLNGKLTISEAFLVDKTSKRKICGFIRGYCTGVIETLLDISGITLICKECPLKSLFKNVCVFEFSINA